MYFQEEFIEAGTGIFPLRHEVYVGQGKITNQRYCKEIAFLAGSRETVGERIRAGGERGSGETFTISAHTDSTPDLNGARAVPVLSPDTFSIPEAVTIAGNGGTMTPALPPTYRFAPGLNTTTIAAALLTTGSTPTDLPSIDANLEIEITNGTDILTTL
jgi:hypothetical protein